MSKKLAGVALVIWIGVVGLVPVGAQSPDNAITADTAAAVQQVWQLGRGRVVEMAWLPDNETIVAASSTGIWLYTLNTPLPAAPVIPYPTYQHRVAISPNTGRIGVEQDDQAIHLYDLAGAEMGTVTLPEAVALDTLAFSEDGVWLAGSSGPTIFVWNVATGSLSATWEAAGTIADLRLNHNGTQLAGLTYSNEVYWWEVATQQQAPVFEAEDLYAFGSLTFSPDSRLLAVPAVGGIWLLDTATGTLQSRLEIDHERPDQVALYEVVFGPTAGQLVAIGTDFTDKSGYLWAWDIETGDIWHRASAGQSFTNQLAISQDASRIAYYSYDGSLGLWTLADDTVSIVVDDHYAAADVLALDATGGMLVAGGYDWMLHFFGLVANTETGFTDHWAAIKALAFSPDNQWFASATHWETLLWATGDSNSQPPRKLDAVIGETKALAFSPDSERLLGVSVTLNDEALLWQTGLPDDPTVQITTLGAVFDEAVFTADAAWVVTATADQGLTVRETATSRVIVELPHEGDPLALAFDAGATRLAVAYGSTVVLYDTTTWTEVFNLPQHEQAIYTLAFSPDGSLLVSGSVDRTVKVADATTGTVYATLEGHNAAVTDLRFNADSTRLFSASFDSTVRVWGVKR